MKQLKTILHIVISLQTGGLEKFVIDLINCTNKNFNHKVLCLERAGELALTSGISNIISLDFSPGIQWKALSEISSIVRNHDIDLIHTHNEKALFYGSLVGFFCRIPVLHTKHGKNLKTVKARLRNNLLARFCTRIVAVSQDAASQCILDEKIPAYKVMTILNGVDTDIFSPNRDIASLKHSLGIANNIPVIGIVARLAPIKDHATLIAACQILKLSGIDFHLLVVGDGPLKNELLSLADTLQLAASITFAGARFDIPILMNAMDVFVLSSVSEGISLTLIEAMACELPIVATNVGGNPEVVIEGETGFLVPKQAPGLMAERIKQLLSNIALRQEFGRKGRLRAIKCFSIKRVGQQYEDQYRTVLRNRSA